MNSKVISLHGARTCNIYHEGILLMVVSQVKVGGVWNAPEITSPCSILARRLDPDILTKAAIKATDVQSTWMLSVGR